MTNEPPRVVLVRHGETAWSRDRRHTGRTDIPLTRLGETQAAALAPRLAGWEFDKVLVSPLSRARATAELAGLEDPETDPDLVEWDYGDYEGRTTRAIREIRPGWELFGDGVPGARPSTRWPHGWTGWWPASGSAPATSSVSPTPTCCGSWPCGGWAWTRSRPATWCSGPPRSACSGGSASRP